jgi:hypothetical protein
MLRHRFLVLIVAALTVLGSKAYGLTKNLEELITEKGIVMPDLAARYPDAEAVIILDEKDIEQSRIVNPVYIARHVVIKIMKESAIEKFRTIKVPYYREVSFTDFQARTINGAQITDVKDIANRDVDLLGADKGFIFPLEQANTMYALRKEELNTEQAAGDLLKISDNPVIHDKGAAAFRIRQIDFPDVKVGSVIEYYYRIESKRFVLYDRYFFMQEYPVLKASYIMHNSKMLRFSYEPTNFVSKPTMVMENRFTNLENQYNTNVRTNLRTIDVSDNPDKWQFFGHVYFQLAMDTLAAYPTGTPFTPPYRDLTERIDVFLREGINLIQRGDNDYRTRAQSFSPSWNFVVHRMTVNYMVNERVARQAKTEIAKAIANASTPEEKVSAAVAWARQNIKDNGEMKSWDGYYWGSKPKMPDDLLRNKVGNADDINFFLVSALQLNGVPVYPAYTKSRERGLFLMKVISETQFDTPLIALETGSRRFKFWQPVSEVPLPADYVDASLGGTMVFVNQSGVEDVTFINTELPILPAESSVSQVKGTLTLGADGSMTGKVEQQVNGHLNATLRKKLSSTAEQERTAAWLSTLGGKFAGTGTATAQIGDLATAAGELKVSADVTLKGVAQATDKGLTVNAALINDPYCSLMPGEPRTLPVDFPYPADFQSTLEIAVPAGYAMPDSVPIPIELRTKGLYYNLVIAKQGPGTLLIKREFKMGEQGLPERIYNTRYVNILKQIHEADNRVILLKKK